jgi:hypothetical protein
VYWGPSIMTLCPSVDKCISCNPSITLEIIEKYINKINFNGLSINTFDKYNKKVKIIYGKIKLFHYLSFSKIIYDLKRHIITKQF